MTAPARSTSMEPELDTQGRRRAKAKDEGTLDLFGGVTHTVEVRAHLRTVPGPPPATGAERRDSALEAMSEKDAVRLALDYVREQLITIYKSRRHWMPQDRWFVHADDADKVLREWARYPTELNDVSSNWKGSIFRGKGWERTGRMVQSKRAHMNATDLPCWRWVGE